MSYDIEMKRRDFEKIKASLELLMHPFGVGGHSFAVGCESGNQYIFAMSKGSVDFLTGASGKSKNKKKKSNPIYIPKVEETEQSDFFNKTYSDVMANYSYLLDEIKEVLSDPYRFIGARICFFPLPDDGKGKAFLFIPNGYSYTAVECYTTNDGPNKRLIFPTKICETCDEIPEKYDSIICADGKEYTVICVEDVKSITVPVVNKSGSVDYEVTTAEDAPGYGSSY